MLPSNSKTDWVKLEPAILPSRARNGWISLAVLFCVGGLCAAMARGYLFSRVSPVEAVNDRIIESIPQTNLTPEDVVRKQIDSMRASIHDPDALVACYSLASPTNREMTGPFDRFLRLTTTDPYRQIGLCRDYQIGSAVIQGGSASVLVSLLAEGGHGFAFQFLLGLQSDPPYRDCWMTDGVVPLLPADSGEKGVVSQQVPTGKVDPP